MFKRDKRDETIKLLQDTMAEGDTVIGIWVDTISHEVGGGHNIRYFHQTTVQGTGQLFDITRQVARALELFNEYLVYGGIDRIKCNDNGSENIHRLAQLVHPEANNPGYSLTYRYF